MNGFQVVPDSILSLALLVGRADKAADLFIGQFNHDLKSGGGAFGLISEPLGKLREQALTNTTKARDLAHSSSLELFATYHWYRGKEQEVLADLDSKLPEVVAKYQDEYGLPDRIATESYDDVQDASDPLGTGNLYRGPGSPDFDEALRRDQWPVDWENKLGEMGDKIAISGIARAIMNKLAGFDLLAKLGLLISGDWPGIYRESLVFTHTAKAFEHINLNIRRGRFAIQDEWEGNAAAGAKNWLEAYAKSCAAHSEFLEDVARKTERLAKAAYHQFSVIDTVLDTLIDSLADAPVVLQLPLFGNLFDSAEGAGDIFRAILAVINELTGLIDLFWALAHEFSATMAVLMGQGSLVAGSWPSLAYDHPQAS
ncbi:hypothetical protein ACIA8G_08880 [Lentzea sp. NPDC051213]|uniref:hypothetical protein n=1 Tax=Lentzea sp. NPDC051213 TaxID=3364126 RepID=UPI0037962C6E